MKKALLLGMLVFASALRADVYLINGERVEGEVHEVNGKLTICTDEMCLVIPPGAVRVDGGAPAYNHYLTGYPPYGAALLSAAAALLRDLYRETDKT